MRINVASQSCRITLFALSQSKFRFENTFDTSLREAYVGGRAATKPRKRQRVAKQHYSLFTHLKLLGATN